MADTAEVPMLRLFMHLFYALIFVVLGCSTAFAQSPTVKPTPDTLAAAFAKAKRLTAKVTINAKDIPPRDVFAQISDQLVDRKLGALVVVTASGISLPATLTVAAKDEPLNLVLAKVLKPLGFSFIVVSKEDDADDGRVRIVKYDPKLDPVAVKPAETVPPASAEDEKLATAKLEAAKVLQDEKKLDRAKVLYKYIVKNHPGTKAAAEAKERLEKLDP